MGNSYLGSYLLGNFTLGSTFFGNCSFLKLSLGKLYILEVVFWKITLREILHLKLSLSWQITYSGSFGSYFYRKIANLRSFLFRKVRSWKVTASEIVNWEISPYDNSTFGKLRNLEVSSRGKIRILHIYKS